MDNLLIYFTRIKKIYLKMQALMLLFSGIKKTFITIYVYITILKNYVKILMEY